MAISLGDVNFGLGADVGALNRSVTKLRQFGQEVERVAKSQKEGADRVASAMRKQEQAITGALQKTLSLNAAIRRADGGKELVSKSNAAWREYNNTLTRTTLSTLEMQRANTKLSAELGTIRRQLANLAAENKKADTAAQAQNLRNLATAATLATGPLGSLASRLTVFASLTERTTLANAAFVAGLIGTTYAVTRLTSAIISNARQLGAVRSQLGAIAGSADAAGAAFQSVVKIAQDSGTVLSSTATQYSRFMAAAKGTVLEGQRAEDIFRDMALVAGTLQMPIEQTEGVFRALEQMMSKGTVQAEELRGQLGDRLPGAFNLAAEAMGVSTRKLGEMMKKGEVMSSEFLPKFAEAVKKHFNINGPVDNLNASINRVSTQWTLMLDAMDRTLGISTATKAVLDGTAASLEWLRKNSDSAAAALGGLAGALAVVYRGQLLAWGAAAIAMLTRLRTAIIAMTVAVASTGIGGLVIALTRIAAVAAGAAAGILMVRNAASGADADFDALTASITQYTAAAKNMKLGVAGDGLSKQAQLTAQISKDYQEINKLQKQQQAAARDTIKVGGLFEFSKTPFANKQNEQAEARIEFLQNRIASTTKLYKELGEAINTVNAPAPKEDPYTDPKDAAKAAREAERRAEALAQTTLEYNRLSQSIEALGGYGTTALERLNKQFERDDKVRQYAEALNEAGIKGKLAADAVSLYSTKLEEFEMLQDEAQKMQEVTDSVARGFDRLGASITEMATNGKFEMTSFRSVLASVLQDIANTITQMYVMKPLKDALFGSASIGGGDGLFGSFLGRASDWIGKQGWFNTYSSPIGPTMSAGAGGFFGLKNGGAFSGGVKMFAKGDVFNAPTAFGMAGGNLGVMGEAGAEAIMPLTRGSDGKLGVRAHGSRSTDKPAGNTYVIDARGADRGAVLRLEQMLLAMAGPGVIEKRVMNAQTRGVLS